MGWGLWIRGWGGEGRFLVLLLGFSILLACLFLLSVYVRLVVCVRVPFRWEPGLAALPAVLSLIFPYLLSSFPSSVFLCWAERSGRGVEDWLA
jgi:hypothetical protein